MGTGSNPKMEEGKKMKKYEFRFSWRCQEQSSNGVETTASSGRDRKNE